MADDQVYLAGTVAVVVTTLAWHIVRKRFDPFEPIWVFLVGYLHVYVVQAISVREWALNVRGAELVTAANQRAFWAVIWFLLVYHLGPGRWLGRKLPRPPQGWSVTAVLGLSPLLIAWGLYCAAIVMAQGLGEDTTASPELTVFRSFPFVMMVAGIMLIVSGNLPAARSRFILTLGLAVVSAYVFIWMFNGKRSHSLIGILASVCAYYVTKAKRPSWPVLLGTAFAGALVVAVAIGWRNNPKYERSPAGFVEYLCDFQLSSILVSLNIVDDDGFEAEFERPRSSAPLTYETIEYGAFLLMMDTVPEKTEYDYGANYIRIFSTFIPRFLWPDKPLYGREQWIKAWQAGSELKRDDEFTSPAIGILGATQLNGGAVGTFLVLAAIATGLGVAYGYFHAHSTVPCVQAWWALWYYNAWFMVVNDDPAVWFYYNWGFTCLPILALVWFLNAFSPAPGRVAAATTAAVPAAA